MKNELIFVHDWVGPLGPLNNHKVPDVYDLMKRMPHTSWVTLPYTDEHDPTCMTLKKYVNCRIVPSYDFKSIGDSPFFYEIILTPRNDYGKITLSSSIGVLDTTPLNRDVLDAVRTGNGYILLTSMYESFLEDRDFQQIHSYFTEHQIPLNKVVYLTNCANSDEVYQNYCLRKGVEKQLRCEYVNLYLLSQTGALEDEFYGARSDSLPKDKVFLNLNRRHRSHRYAILLKFFEHKLLDKACMSFSKDVAVEQWIHDTRRITQFYKIALTTDELYKVYDSLPYVLDSHDFSRFPVEDDLKDTSRLYDNTYVSLVSETNFETNIIHMTEKTIKPIIFKQPFIIVGPTHTLHYLKKLGFKTFGEFWNEDYDSEPDPVRRMNMILELCKKISKWSTQEWVIFYKRTKDIRKHNFRTLKNLQPTELNNFVEKYGV